MTNLTNWLNANKISLNVKKTELVIFKHKKKKLECPIRSKLSRKRLNSSNSVKYVCVKSYENLNRKDHIHDIATKLNRAKAILLKITNYLNCNTFKLIYFAIFDSDINYTNLKWGKNLNSAFRACKICSIFCSKIHNYDTVSSSPDTLFKPSYRTDSYGEKKTVIIGAIKCWNKKHLEESITLITLPK